MTAPTVPTILTVPPKPYPGFAQSLLVLLLFFVFANLLSIPAVVLMALKLHHWGHWALLLGQLAGTALALKACLGLGHKTWADVFPSRSVPLTVWPLTLLATAGLILIINGVDGWLSQLIPPPAWFRQMFIGMGWPGVVLGAPLTEEPLFRGLILGGFVLRYGTRKAIFYSALLFALVHMNPWQFPTGLLMGAFLGWLTLRTGSLWPAVFAHFLNNLGATLAHVFHIPYLADAQLQPIWMWGMGALLVGLGLVGLARMTQEPESPLLIEEEPA